MIIRNVIVSRIMNYMLSPKAVQNRSDDESDFWIYNKEYIQKRKKNDEQKMKDYDQCFEKRGNNSDSNSDSQKGSK